MRILGIIPARGGSKGVPGKNVKLLNGRPLLEYTAKSALGSRLISQVILSTDDAEIIQVGSTLGLNAPFLRPTELAQDATPTIDVIVHALNWYSKLGIQFDAVCLLQVTSPFRTTDFIDQAIAKFVTGGCDSLISVRQVPHEYNPHWTFEKDIDGNLRIATGERTIIPRRQELPAAYHRDGSIYITKSSVILNSNSLFGESIACIESPSEWYVNIDTPADWKKAEALAAKWVL